MFIANKKFILAIAVFLLISQAVWGSMLMMRPNAFWWVDIILHFFGGLMVAAILLGFLEEKPHIFILSQNKFFSLIVIVSFVALIGVLWEFYEYALDYFLVIHQMKLSDTLFDLFFDLLGGATAGIIYLTGSSKSETDTR